MTSVRDKSIYTDRIAKKIELSEDKVDQRMLKMHKIFKEKKLDLIDLLGVKKKISNSLLKGFGMAKMMKKPMKQKSQTLRGLSEILDKEINGSSEQLSCFKTGFA